MNIISEDKKKYVVEEADSLLIPKIDPENTDPQDDIENEQSGENIVSKFRKMFAGLKLFNLKNPVSKPDASQIKSKKRKKLIISASVILLLFALLLVQSVMVWNVYKRGMSFKSDLEKLVATVTAKDVSAIENELSNSKEGLYELNSSYKYISWMRMIPFAGKFVDDGQHAINAGFHSFELMETVLGIVKPYSDIIGFKNSAEANSDNDQTTQDKLDFVVKTVPDIIPKADEIIEKTALIKNEIDGIDPQDYPVSLANYEIRENIKKVVEMTDQVSEMAKNGKPFLEALPYLMGVDGERTYLLIFQNDKELRPTGGFITAYSIAKVNSGKFEPTTSDDIYNLDNNYTPSIKAPEPIINYIKGPYLLSDKLRLRDMNWSPDFSESMELFSKEIKKAGLDNIDGIIAVDTQVLVNLLDVLGPIDVPGYGKFSTEIVSECNCPQVIYELESFADIEGPIVWSENEPGKIVFAPPNYDNRKKIIGPLMNSILSNTLGQSNEKMPAIFEAAIKSLAEKHVLFYLIDEKAQKAVEEFGIGGVLLDYEGDYLYVNDANLGGRKSNIYVTQEVLQEVEVADDGGVTKTVTITYKNPEKHDGWLNSVLPNWVRIYVPKGSELISAEGLEEKNEPYEEFGKTVFAGFFELRPLGVAKVVLKYKLPQKFETKYSVYVQKQPGKDYSLYTFKVNSQQSEQYLRSDKEFGFAIK